MNGPLSLRQVIPSLTVSTRDGKTIRAWDFKQKQPLVIVFLHTDCLHCKNWLAQFAERATDLLERETIAIVVYSGMHSDNTETLGIPVVLPFIVTADNSGLSQRAFLGTESVGSSRLDRVGTFVTDRYGDLFGQWIEKDGNELPPAGEILDLLGVIQIIC